MKGIDDFGFTEEQKIYIRAIMAKRVKKTHEAFFRRYGVKSLDELDDLVMKAKRIMDAIKAISQ